MRCPVHHLPLILEDRSADYGQETWVCPELDHEYHAGPSDASIYDREHPRSLAR